MKIKICRQTGLPVDLSDLETFKEEFRRLFDIAKRICKNDMLRLNMKLGKIERLLGRKYPTVSEVDFCDTPEKMSELISKYGNIKAGIHAESNDLVYVIDDQFETEY